MINNNVKKQLSCFVFTDLLVLAECIDKSLVKYKLERSIKLNEYSIIRSEQNQKYLENLFTITSSNQSITLCADKENVKNDFIQLVKEVIICLRKKRDMKDKHQTIFEKNFIKQNAVINISKSINITANVIGTEERNVEGFKRFLILLLKKKY